MIKLISRILKEVNEFQKIHKRRPKEIYLGLKECEELILETKREMGENYIPKKLMGMNIIVISKESYLKVY